MEVLAHACSKVPAVDGYVRISDADITVAPKILKQQASESSLPCSFGSRLGERKHVQCICSLFFGCVHSIDTLSAETQRACVLILKMLRYQTLQSRNVIAHHLQNKHAAHLIGLYTVGLLLGVAASEKWESRFFLVLSVLLTAGIPGASSTACLLTITADDDVTIERTASNKQADYTGTSRRRHDRANGVVPCISRLFREDWILLLLSLTDQGM